MITSVLIVLKHLIYGGTEKYTLNLANSLAEKGISVTLISGDGPLASHVSPKVNLYIMPISRKPRIKQITEKRILAIAEATRPQIIHAQCRTSLICSQLARKTLNIPIVTHEHHMYDPVDYPFIVNELIEGAEKIITIGPYTAKELVKNGVKKDAIVSVLNGVDTKTIFPITEQERKLSRESLGLLSSDKVVVCLSRLEPGKGIDKLAMGFVKVAKALPDAKLIIVGDDQDGLVKPLLRKIVEDNNLQKKVFILNGEYNVRKYHAVADVFCYPALSKGMAVMEAMAAGLPIVGKRTARKPFVVEDTVSGLMTEITAQYRIDPDQIAEKLVFLLSHSSIAKQMGKAARKRVERKFNLDMVIANILNVYKDVIDTYEILPKNTFVPDSVVTLPL